MYDVVLHPGRDKAVRRRHPWVLSGSVAREPGATPAGELARVTSAEGEVLGYGDYSPRSQLRVRLVAFGKDAPAADWLDERLAASAERRATDPLLEGTDALRLANAEGDGLPGLVLDRYAGVVVVRASTAAMAARRAEAVRFAATLPGVTSVVARDDATAARREGFEPSSELLAGAPPPARVEIREHGRVYQVDVARGQKTGFYLDQRDARSLVERLARGRRVLDLFAYTGGFAAAAARGGAPSVTLVDASEAALALARAHVERNRGGACEARFVVGDAFEAARRLRERFDLLVVDPPPLARRSADVQRASRAYKDVFLHALRAAAPGAFVLVFRCSHHVSSDLLRKIAFGASLDAQRPVQVLATLGAPSDHPVALDHPEGEYLSGLLLRA
ncbi:MAG TPA: class I SAM-dependent rRNA methyltransferase [Myxococcota bacterium]|nr:class I SAM-dependent rRNA methyltransferase [Myxococcota bacterium]